MLAFKGEVAMRSVLNSSLSLRKRTPRLRVGFTLIELMVVIVIIAILIGLLVPAVMGVRKTARDVEVRTDISKLEDAIAKFKVTYGTEPPSQLTLYAVPADWELTAVSRRHKGLIKQLWPQFNFATCGGLSTGASFIGPWPATQTTLDLSGSECLVFFLGGLVSPTSGAFSGFSKDPQYPFGAGTTREGPFFEFNGSVILPLGTAGDVAWNGRLTDKDGDWFPEYRDTLPQQQSPYLYFNGTNGYRTDFPTSPWHNTDNYNTAVPAISINNAYYSSLNLMTAPAMSAPHKPKGIQIISPGADGQYGIGGLFNPAMPSALSDNYDRDNITNFHSGRLGG